MMLFRCFLFNGKSALVPHLAVLIHDAVNASLFHCLTVVNML